MRRQMPCDSCARAGKVHVAQYRCPACARCSCSLACVKDHKAHYACTGVRDKSAPLPVRQYNEHKVISDYSVLEEAKRKLDDGKRNRTANNAAKAPAKHTVPDPIPRYKQRIMGEEAAKRGIDLRFMPSQFFRHQNNTSHVKSVHYNAHTGATRRPFERIMVWRVDIHFCGPSGGTRLVQVHDVDEDVNMADLLERAIEKLEVRKEPRLNGDVDQYLLYAGMSGSKLNAYLRNDTDLGTRKAEPSILPDLPSCKRRRMENGSVDPTAVDLDTRGFIPIDTDSTLRESLHGAMVVEYPILFVAPKGSSDDKRLQSATKSLFTKPEQEVDDTLHCPGPPIADGGASEAQHDCGQTDVRMADTHEPDAQERGRAQETGEKRTVSTPSLSSGDAAKVIINAENRTNQADPPQAQQRSQKGKAVESGDSESELSDQAEPSEAQMRGQKRKAVESGDSESEISELEKNIVMRLTPRKANGGKTGYSAEGKIRIAEPKKSSPAPFCMPKFRSVLPPVGYDKRDVSLEKDVDVNEKDGEETDVKCVDREESEGVEEQDSADEGISEGRSVTGEDSPQMSENLDADESLDDVDKSDGDEEDESEEGSDEDEELKLEDEQKESREELEVISKESSEDGNLSPERKRARNDAVQDRPRPLKRRRFEDLDAIEPKREECTAGEREDVQGKASKKDEIEEIEKDGDTEKSRKRMPTVSSPPPPFLKVDSVLLETRIPRRKKMPDQNGREPLFC